MKGKLKIIVAIVVAIIVGTGVIIAINISNREPSDYEEKIEKMGKAFSDKSEMEEVIEDGTIDLPVATAWQEIVGDYDETVKIDNLKNELKKIKTDDKRMKELKEALIEYAEEEEEEEYKIKVTNIRKPKQNEKNKKIWTVKATLNDYDYVFIFYKDNIIDVGDDFEEKNGDMKVDSWFKMMIEYYNL